MKPVWAIARLTFWEGVRMKINVVFILMLVFIVLRMPFALRGDETLAGRLQTFLDYSLSALSLLVGLATVFFSCATLTGEIKSNTLHLVLTKPVTRFQVLLGKWLGVNLLAILLVVSSGLVIYGFARYIRSWEGYFERDKLQVRDVVWTARASGAPVRPDFVKTATERVEQRIRDGGLEAAKRDAAIHETVQELESDWRSLGPGEYEVYHFEKLPPPEAESEVIQVRFKARGVPQPRQEILELDWMFVDPQTEQPLMPAPFRTRERSGDMHQFLVSARAIRDGKAALFVGNPHDPDSRVRALFEGRDSLQILYKVGSFEANYLKTLLMTLFRLAFLSAVGVMFSTFVSFPVACLGAFATYLIALASPWWLEAIGANLQIWSASIDPFGQYGPYIRFLLVPILRVLFPDFVRLDGASKLVDGAVIPNDLVGAAFAQTVVFGGVLVLAVGWLVFRRREIAEVTVQ
ncbi:MAG: ABC transporter permease [Phycisphaerae bacterium]